MVNDESINMQVPESKIVINENGADLVTGKIATDSQNANDVKSALQQVQPLAPPEISQSTKLIEIDPANPSDINTILRGLLSKGAKIGLERLESMLSKLTDSADPTTVLNIIAKLIDLHMALDWSERFEKAILKTPGYMSANRSAGTSSATIQGKAGTLTKIMAGDKRTLPKKLLSKIPKDDIEGVA